MVKFDSGMNIKQLQDFIGAVYLVPNNRNFEFGEMLDNVSRFTMRALKGIRKKDNENVTKNMVISLSWFLSMLNRLYIDVEEELWMRFPFVCSYCNSESCVCALKRPLNRQKVIIDESKRPKTVRAFQEMFEKIYPAPKRTLEHAGVHLAEELGEFSEAFWIYRASKSKGDFEQLSLEAADFLSCFMVVFNSLNVDLASELSKYYFDNCHVCHKAPCECTYEYIKSFK